MQEESDVLSQGVNFALEKERMYSDRCVKVVAQETGGAARTSCCCPSSMLFETVLDICRDGCVSKRDKEPCPRQKKVTAEKEAQRRPCPQNTVEPSN